MPERIWIVGHAATTCLGRDLDATWEGLTAGRSGLKRHETLLPAPAFRRSLAGVVADFRPGDDPDFADVRRLSGRSIHTRPRRPPRRPGSTPASPGSTSTRTGSPWRSARPSAASTCSKASARRASGGAGRSAPFLSRDSSSTRPPGEVAERRALRPERRPGERLRLGRPRGGARGLVPALGRGRPGPLRRGRERPDGADPQRVRLDADPRRHQRRRPGREPTPREGEPPRSASTAARFVLGRGGRPARPGRRLPAVERLGLDAPGGVDRLGRRTRTATTWPSRTARRGRPLPGDAAARTGRRPAGRGRLLQRPRHQHDRQRPGGDRGVEGRLWRG